MGMYIDGATGAILREKPEDMTHLHGNVLVKKTHPRIVLRGVLDGLTAAVLETQLTAAEAGETQLCADLQELLELVRQVMAAEVKDEPLAPPCLFGLEEDALRRQTRQVEETFGMAHPVPHWRMGRVCAALNTLRTGVRKAELETIRALPERTDLILAMNRASSAVYVIFCRKLSGFYEKHPKEE